MGNRQRVWDLSFYDKWVSRAMLTRQAMIPYNLGYGFKKRIKSCLKLFKLQG